MNASSALLICGELQGIIAKLRQEDFGVARSLSTNVANNRNVFSLREPSKLKRKDIHDLRKVLNTLTGSTCKIRDKLRQLVSSVEKTENDLMNEVLECLAEIIRNPGVGSMATGEALSCVHRLLNEVHIFPVSKVAVIVDAIVNCDFIQTETGDDEIAIMWALETFDACCNTTHLSNLDFSLIEAVMVVLYKNCTCESSADMLRRYAARKLSHWVRVLFASYYSNTSKNTNDELVSFLVKVFRFLCHCIDPQIVRDGHTTHMSLDLIIEALSESVRDNKFLILENTSLKNLVLDDLCRATVMISQVAGRTISVPKPTDTPQPADIVAIDANTVPTIGDSQDHMEYRGLLTFDALDEIAIRNSLAKQKQKPRVSLQVLSRCLRIFQMLVSFPVCRRMMKTQIEAFFQSVFLRVLEPPSRHSDLEARRLVLETLTDLFSEPTLLVDLYTNYDCSGESNNICELLFEYLSNFSFPRTRKVALDSLQLMALRCIHLGVASISNRLGGSLPNPDMLEFSPEALLQEKRAKAIRVECAQAFNQKPKLGVKALLDAGIIESDNDAVGLAKFLRTCPHMDKTMIGEFIGSSSEISASVLKEFIATFNMRDQPLLRALRIFLESFRLPGEAQMIDRVLQNFAESAHAQCSDAKNFPTVDCTYLFCFSIILLNTDLHNPNIRPEKKMSYEAFMKQNLNYGPEVSCGQDMPTELLRSIYDEIKDREINTMSEGSAVTGAMTAERWHDSIRTPKEMKLISEVMDRHEDKKAILRAYDEQLFLAIEKSSFVALSVVYYGGDVHRQPKAVDLALEGILACAKIASSYEIIPVLDAITVDLCKVTSLLKYGQSSSKSRDSDAVTEDDQDDNSTANDDGHDADSSKLSSPRPPPPVHATNRPVVANAESYQQTVENSLKDLSSTAKAVTATNTVFEIARRYGKSLRRAWPTVMYCLLRLFDMELLPSHLLVESQDRSIDTETRLHFHRLMASPWMKQINEKVKKAQDQVQKANGWAGWFNGESKAEAEDLLRIAEDEMFVVSKALRFASNSLSNLQGDTPVVDSNQAAKSHGVRIGNLVEESNHLPDSALLACIGGLVLACGGVDSKDARSAVKTVDIRVGEDSRGDVHVDMLAPSSMPARLFAIHMLIEIAMHNVHRIELTWPLVSRCLMDVLADESSEGCTVEKAFVGLARIVSKIAFTKLSDALAADVVRCINFLLVRAKPAGTKLVLRTFSTTVESYASEQSREFSWSPGTTEILSTLSDVSIDIIASDGIQLLRVMVSHPEIAVIPFGDAMKIIHKFRGTVMKDLRNPSSPDDSSEVLVDILNLVFILLSKMLSSSSRNSVPVDLCFDVCNEFLQVALDSTLPSQLRLHATSVLVESIHSLVENVNMPCDKWGAIFEMSSQYEQCDSTSAPDLVLAFHRLLYPLLESKFPGDRFFEDEPTKQLLSRIHVVLKDSKHQDFVNRIIVILCKYPVLRSMCDKIMPELVSQAHPPKAIEQPVPTETEEPSTPATEPNTANSVSELASSEAKDDDASVTKKHENDSEAPVPSADDQESEDTLR